jgi:hypothetical protein
VKALAITGVGLVSPIGTGFAAFREGLSSAHAADIFRTQSSVLSPEQIPDPFVAEVRDFDPTPVLGLVYLNPHLTQGTCFFHNRVLGTHTIVGEEQLKRLGDFMNNESEKYEPTDYAVNDSEAWQKIYTIEGLFNRLVVYPGNVFHSIDVTDVPDKVSVPEARLTQRIIVQDTRPKDSVADAAG